MYSNKICDVLSLPRPKVVGAKPDSAPSFSAQNKNAWMYLYTPIPHFKSMYLIKDSSNFTILSALKFKLNQL
jgi:hypothetical protein